MDRLVVALDDGYASYDQETSILVAAGARFEVVPCRGSEARAMAAVREADVVLVRESPVSRAVIGEMTRCRAILRYGIGVDNIDQAAARERGVMVGNVPDYGTEEVASQAVALALAAVRRVRLHDAEVRAGRWSTGVLAPMYRLRGRTLGLIGYGRIARRTHQMLAGFGFARTLVNDPSAETVAGIEAVDVDTICREADLISLHAPLTAQTRHLIDARRIALMRPTAVLVNTARGGLIDLDALAAALSEGRILGAGLDVFEQEPLPADHPLRRSRNTLLTSHTAWYSTASIPALQQRAAETAALAVRGLPLRHVVNTALLRPTP
jgi:D-3-phosphoglycerate dehydrogenase